MTAAKFFLGLLILAAPLPAFGDGSVSFSEDVLPLLKKHPEISNPLLREIEVSPLGSATRIGARACPGLAGKRVSPYIFAARERVPGGAEFLLIVNTDIDFLDRAGDIVFRIQDGVPESDDSGFYDAIALHETLSSLELRVIKPASNER